MNQLLKDIEALLQKQVSPVPKGWKSVKQFAEECEINPRTAREHLSKLVKAGAYEVKNFPVIIDGRIRQLRHYKKRATT